MEKSPTKGSLAVVFLTVFIDLLGFGIVLPLLPIYGRLLLEEGENWKLGLLMASFSAMQFVFSPLWGRLSDRIGRRPVLMAGLAGSVIFYALFGYATAASSLTLLFVSRIGAGVMGATISTAQAYIADCTTVENRSKGMALIGMAFGLGFTFGPLVGFLAVPTPGSPPGPWPGYAAAILSAVAFGLAVGLLPESRTADAEPAESRGFVALRGLRQALSVPSIGMVLVAIFVCIFSFGNFESTLSIVIKGGEAAPNSPFAFTWGNVCLTYAYIGLILCLVQGGVVRRVATRLSEAAMCQIGVVLEIAGFAGIWWSLRSESVAALMAGLTVVVAGFSFLQPSLNGLLSRRSDPQRQGVILGVGQSVSSLARILGPFIGIVLLERHIELPYLLAIVMMALGSAMIVWASRKGTDFDAGESSGESSGEASGEA